MLPREQTPLLTAHDSHLLLEILLGTSPRRLDWGEYQEDYQDDYREDYLEDHQDLSDVQVEIYERDRPRRRDDEFLESGAYGPTTTLGWECGVF